MCKVTVFTTIYNVAKYLPRFFECMERQSFSDYKHLIIDDGSEDESYNICKKQAEKDKRIELVRTEHVGISAARNMALSMIETPFATSVDGDDVYEDNYLLHLIEAQEKHDADLVISRVAYRNEVYEKTWETPARGELVISRSDFPEMLPLLLEDARLNFLYGKLYRTEVLKNIRVENDVEQGSDTMINCQFLKKANIIVCIDDLDTNWIHYSSRSVTSYKGINMYRRMIRIQKYLTDTFRESGFLNSEMQRVIDKRIFQSMRWSIDRLTNSTASVHDAIETLREMEKEQLYIDAYERQKKRGDLNIYGFQILSPEEILPSYVEKKIAQLEKRFEKERERADRQKFPGRKIRELLKM